LRGTIVFGVLLVMLIVFGAAVAARPRTAHDAPVPKAGGGTATVVVVGGSGSAVTAGATAGAASASAAAAGLDGGAADAASGADASAEDAGPVRLLDRPLRVVTIGWDLAAPGLLVNGGPAPGAKSEFSAAGVDVHLASVDSMQAVEVAMARGGADKDGADVAIVAMPELVSSYERLRALSPEIFFVVGFSRGREAVVASRDALPTPPVKGDVHLAAVPGSTAGFVALFVLDAAGIPPSGVQFVSPTSKADDAPLAAIDRGVTDPASAGRPNLLLTTADMPRLVPFVAVAQRGMLEKNGRALAAWARVWLEGTQKLAADAPTAARQIAASPGAPDPLSLLKRLGEVTPATLGDNVRMAGLSGRGALTLDRLFERAWQLFRGADVLATPIPEAVPVSSAVIASIARSSPALVDPPAVRSGGGPEGGPKKAEGGAAEKGKSILVHRQPEGKLDEEGLIAQAGFLAAVFERSSIRVAVQPAGAVDAGKTKKVIERVQDRFDVPPGRLIPARAALGKGAAALEILAVP
jgi:hypothetical protein